MARLIKALHRSPRNLFSSSSSSSSSYSFLTHINGLQKHQQSSTTFLFPTRTYASEITKSPFESNIIRILRTEIQYQSEYAPTQQPLTKFNSFHVQDRPGEQWITLTGKFGEDDIKIEATMFDGCVLVPKRGEDSTGEDLRLHISLLVDISKGEGSDPLEFVCSAWPDSLEIQKVYILQRDKMLTTPYMGPDFKALDRKVQDALREFLEARGVNDELSAFLHGYIMNKDRTELIRWLGNVKSFVEK